MTAGNFEQGGKMGSRSKAFWLLWGLIGTVFALVLAACSSGQVGPTATPSVQGAPSISFATEQADLGRIPLDKEVRYDFRFTNVGSEPLVIQKTSIAVLEGC